MAGEGWLEEHDVAAITATSFLVLVLMFALRQAVRRRTYTRLAPAERELLARALLLVVHDGAVEKGQCALGHPRAPARVLGDLLGLDVHMVDTALGRLIEHGYLNGLPGSRFGSLITHLETTPKGRRFHERHFGTTGGVFEAAPLGLVVLTGQSSRFASLAPAPDALLLRHTDNWAEPPSA